MVCTFRTSGRLAYSRSASASGSDRKRSQAPSEREVRSGLCAMAFVVRSARVVDQKLAEARARLRRVEPEERLRVFVGRGPAEGGGRRGEQYESRHLLVAEGPRDYDHE